MTLCDTGPLIALMDKDDRKHKACIASLSDLATPLLTTWPCLAEAMYLLAQYGGHAEQEKLWRLIENGTLALYTNTEAEIARMRELMRQYRDRPMDLADASLVAAAETLGISRLFRACRISGCGFAYRTLCKTDHAILRI